MLVRLAFLLFAFAAGTAQAQFATPTLPFVQLGLKGLPGAGVQGAFVMPAATVFTREGALYLDYVPDFEGVEGLLVGLGLGGSVRVFRTLTVLADYDAGPYDLDLGFRFGPSFFFSFTERAAASKARSFRLFTEPFVRGSVRLNRRVLYVELGTRPSHLRAGLLLGL
jgi:hypothetical protein